MPADDPVAPDPLAGRTNRKLVSQLEEQTETVDQLTEELVTFLVTGLSLGKKAWDAYKRTPTYAARKARREGRSTRG